MSRPMEIGVTTLLALLALGVASCADAKVHPYKVQVVKEYSHDEMSYTQGLFFLDGQLYETTGQYGESTLRKVDLETGRSLQRLDFDRKYFVEGSVALHGNIYILTWTEGVGLVPRRGGSSCLFSIPLRI